MPPCAVVDATPTPALTCDPWAREEAPSEVAVVGLGDWGRRAILGTLLAAKRFAGVRRLHLVAGDNHSEIAAEVASDPRTTVRESSGYEAVLRDPAVSAVLVCTPDPTHHALGKAALSAGKHVFVEKTFVLEPEVAQAVMRGEFDRARELIEQAERASACTGWGGDRGMSPARDATYDLEAEQPSAALSSSTTIPGRASARRSAPTPSTSSPTRHRRRGRDRA